MNNNVQQAGKEFERKFAFQGYLGNRSFRIGTTPADIWNWIKLRLKEKDKKDE